MARLGWLVEQSLLEDVESHLELVSPVCNPVLCKLATLGNNISLVDNENTLKSFWLYSEVTGLRIQVQEVGSNSRCTEATRRALL